MAEDGLEVQPKPRKRKEKQAKSKAEEIPLHDQTSTKLRVDELLQQVVAQSTKDAVSEVKKKKKKKTKDGDADDAVLESLRKGKGIEGLHKEADTALLNNIYEPDDSPKNEKSNKQRQRKQKSGTGQRPLKDNLEIAEAEKIKAKKKKKDAVESEVPPEPPADLSETKTEESAPVPKTRKKKKAPEDTQSPREDTASPEPETPVSSARAVKKKMKKLVEQLDAQSPASEDGLTETETPVASPRRRGKKKKKAVEEDTEASIPEEAEAQAEEESVAPAPKEETKKKKKKKGAKKEEEEAPAEEEEVAAAAAAAVEAAEKAETQVEEAKAEETKKGKKKKKKKGEEGGGDAQAAEQEGVEGEEGKEEEKVVEVSDDGEVLAIMVHRTDKLKNDFNILHPVVRVHIVDELTGQYLPKQHRERAVSSFYELQNENVEQVLPIMTQPFDFKQKKSTIPMWEELMVFNENFNYFIQTCPKALVLFELRDFVSMNATNNKSESGWHRIAWAFLKVVGGNGKINVGSKLRLQLFQVPSRRFATGVQPEVYHWWKSHQRSPYPSTLYITLKSIVPPDNVEPSLRSMFATQQASLEQGVMTYEDLKRSMNWDSKAHKLEARPLTSWSRLFGQLCRIPNNLILTLPARKKGCFIIRFSHDGRSLACACGSNDGYPILIYEVPSGQLKMELHGHFSLVYDMSWSRKDTHLLSASADGTVRTWNIMEEKPTAEKVLPHPGFVYCCKYHPRLDSIAVSGCYDQVLRVWDLSQDDEGGHLMQEIEDHHGYINSICFDDTEGQKMYSADGVGVVNIWNVYITDEPDRRPFVRDWTLYHKLQEPELKDVQINHIEMHPSGRRLLVHCRDNVIRMFDLRVQRVMQQYIGAVNFREKLGSCITPCGTFIFAGSEDNFVYAWNTDTGDQVARYTELNYLKPVTDVVYHPRDHILAVCSLGENQPVLVYKYDPFTAQVGAGLPSPRLPDEETDVEHLGTASSPMKEDELQLARSKVMSKEEFQVHEKQRLSRIMKKLDSATLQMSQMPGMVTMDTTRRMDTIGRTGVIASWSNTDAGAYVATPRSTMLSPGALSPHAHPTMLSAVQQQQFASQSMYMKQADASWRPTFSEGSSDLLYMKQADASWRPTFSEVGRHGNRSTFFGRPPQIALDNSKGKAQFSFQAPLGSSRKPKKVVALYDYKAQRSDELSLLSGDMILLLHKDSESWWMGELADGQQGFFPANYVAMAEDDEEEVDRKQFTAIKTKDGQLKILSGGEESEDDGNLTHSDLLESKTTNGKKKRVHYSD
ncbi:hypothetical protein ACOMHN_013998 [Nucella lapillus]